MTTRLLFCLVLLVVIQAGVLGWNFATDLKPSESPEYKLRSFPSRLGDWIGRDVDRDPRIVEMLTIQGLEDSLNRRYLNSMSGQEVSLNINEWLGFRFAVPHIPTDCYTRNGWVILSEKHVDIDVGPSATLGAQIMEVSDRDNRATVLYWYQVGHLAFGENQSTSAVQRRLRERYDRWPPLVKVMFHIDAANSPALENQLTDLAKETFKHTSRIQ